MESLPKVSVITPTTHDRAQFNIEIQNIIVNQDYPHSIEHLFDYSSDIIGAKRNRLCQQANGDIIIHADSDDYYATDWITKSVQALQDLQVPCTGLRQMYYHDTIYQNGYLWSYPENALTYLGEATLCYYKSHWERFKHSEVMTGECTPLYYKAKSHNYIDGFVARLHDSNTSSRNQIKSFKPIDINVINSLYKLNL